MNKSVYVTKSPTTEVAALLAVGFGIQVMTTISCSGPIETVYVPD